MNQEKWYKKFSLFFYYLTPGEMVQKVFNCPEGQMYNENTKECSDPCGWPKASFSCTKEGRFSDPKNCNNFITCIKGNNEQEFVQTSRRFVVVCCLGVSQVESVDP